MMRFFSHRPDLRAAPCGLKLTSFVTALILLIGTSAADEHDPLIRILRTEMAQRQIPGLAAAVVRDGKLKSLTTLGLADIENEVPVTSGTIFGFASVSKPITAVAVLQLVEAGRLRLNMPLKECMPDIPVPLHQITVQHLLSHQSGLRHYQTYPDREPLRHFSTLLEAFQSHHDDALLFEPGHRFGYSTYGYLALGCLMEEAGGIPFAGQLRSNVFLRAGMTTARVDDFYEIIPHRARGYIRSPNGALRNSQPFDASDKVPGGGLCGTIGDLAAYAAALQNGLLLSAETMQSMWTARRLNNGTLTDYGLGWHIGKPGSDEVFHSGSQARTSSYLYMKPNARSAVALLCNLERMDFLPLARKIAALE